MQRLRPLEEILMQFCCVYVRHFFQLCLVKFNHHFVKKCLITMPDVFYQMRFLPTLVDYHPYSEPFVIMLWHSHGQH